MDLIISEIKKFKKIKKENLESFGDNKYIKFVQDFENDKIEFSNFKDLIYLDIDSINETVTELNFTNLINLKYLKLDFSCCEETVNIKFKNCESLIYIKINGGTEFNFKNLNKTYIKYIEINTILINDLKLPESIEEIKIDTSDFDEDNSIIYAPKNNLKKIVNIGNSTIILT